MSRAGLYGSLIAVCAAALLVSCRDKSLRLLPSDAAEGPVKIDFSCNNGVNKIGLTDGHNRPAWIVFTDEDQDFGWSVPGNVTINSITLKNGQPVPINVEHQPNGGAGRPLDGKVQKGKKGPHSYMIDVTCRSGGSDFRLIIDPEMIVR